MKEIEIEYKQLLTKEEYELIEQYLIKEDSKSFQQENYYFETLDYKLKDQKKALRIRRKGNEYEACLKQQRELDILEDNIILSEAKAKEIIETPSLLAKYYGIDDELQLLGSLITIRYEYQLAKGLIALDKSMYLGVIDYEIEFEAIDYEQKEVFIEFLNQFNIEFRENKISKIARFNELLMQMRYNI